MAYFPFKLLTAVPIKSVPERDLDPYYIILSQWLLAFYTLLFCLAGSCTLALQIPG